MSGGGKSSKSATGGSGGKTVAELNPTMTVQPFMPGMDQALAQQLSAGFGGEPSDFLAAFAQAYQPMQVPVNAVHTPKAGKDAKAADLSEFQQLLLKRGGRG